ncbi:MAG: hypothetical protein K6F46_02425 [Desulfovibrio sp.]|nr:hypothetical protein [Desulfovibrio sp.]
MNDALKCGLFLLAGMTLGALGAVAVSKGKLNLKPFATDLISRGIDVKDAVMSKVESLKEDFEDMSVEARQKAEKRKVAKAAD